MKKTIISSIKSFFMNIVKKIQTYLGIEPLDDNIEISADANAVGSDTFKKTKLSDKDKEATKAAHDLIQQKKLKKKKLIKKIIIISIFLIVILNVIAYINKQNKKKEDKAKVMQNVQKVRRMDISEELSGSGSLEPKDKYTITSLVDGEITGVYFNVGDKVEKDDLLLTIESSSAERSITTASASLAQSLDQYEKAKKEYEDIEIDYEGDTFKSPYTGYLKTISVKAGDKLKNNQEIAALIDDTIMNIKVPFLSNDAVRLRKDMNATLTLEESGETIQGFVKSIAKEKEVMNNGALISYVTCTVKNPGGLTTDMTARAYISGIYSIGDGSFEVETDKAIVFEDGNDVYIEKMLVDDGAYVKEGDAIFKIDKDSMRNVISTKKNEYLSAQNNYIKSQTQYEDALDNFDEYNITSPISGTVITKDAKVGDKIQNKTSSSTKTLCTIFDLSELTFDMDIDELDISKVKLDQDVNIEADAFNNKKFKGKITNINLVANNSNGVTSYPVTVTITDTKGLLPGMNVDGYVVLSKAEKTLCVPSDALQRGNVVYMLDTSPTIKSGEYKTDAVSDRVKQRAPEGFTAVSVEVGISNENFIEIKSGVQEEDEVYVTQSSNSGFQFMPGAFGGGPPMGGGGPRGG